MIAPARSDLPRIHLQLVAGLSVLWFVASSSGCDRDFMGRPSDGRPERWIERCFLINSGVSRARSSGESHTENNSGAIQ